MSTTVLPGGTRAPAPEPSGRPPWYRRRAVLVGAGLVLVALVAALTDLPVPTSRGSQVSSSRGVMAELNGDLAGCALGVHEAFVVLQEAEAHTLAGADRAATPALLRDDQDACSFTNQSIVDLSNIEVPGSAAGRHLSSVVSAATLWATADALAAIEDIQILVTRPADATRQQELATAERQLAADRATADRQLAAAGQVLGTALPRPDLPALVPPSGG